MNYTGCPTGIVNAPVEIVWTLLTRPEGWGDFYNVRVTAVHPAGPAVVGQKVLGESGPSFLHLKLQFQHREIDELNYRLGLDAKFPLGITVKEDLNCVRLGPHQCRVNYRCGFGFPKGWRGAVTRIILRRGVDSGPVDSLSRLQLAAERLHAGSARE